MVGWGLTDYVSALLSRRIQFRGFIWTTWLSMALILTWGLISRASIVVPPEGILRIAAVQLVSIIGSISFYRALGVGKVSFVAPLSSGWAVVSVLTAMLVYGEAPTTAQLLGGLLIVVGVISASLSWGVLLREFRLVASDPSTLWVAAAILFWGLANANYGPLSEAYGWFPMNWWAWVINSGLVMVALIARRRPVMIGRADSRAWSQAALAAAFSVVATASYTIGVEQGLTAVAAPVASMYPLVAVALAGVFLRERLSRPQLAGGALAMLGLIGMAL